VRGTSVYTRLARLERGVPRPPTDDRHLRVRDYTRRVEADPEACGAMDRLCRGLAYRTGDGAAWFAGDPEAVGLRSVIDRRLAVGP
jgi:hypothetical protein